MFATLRHLAIIGSLSLFATTGAAQAQAAPSQALPPIRIVLVGDSTMAHKSGYGDAFCRQFGPQVTCLNEGRGGRSTKSYRVDGIWDQDVMTALKKTTNDQGVPFAKTYVLMQFGHNDGSPKPERHTDVLWEYPANLWGYAKDAQSTGATFVLVTPISMRDFVDNRLLPDRIAPFAASMQNVAIEHHLPLIDLFGESQRAVQAMGNVAANHYLAGQPIPENVLKTEATGTSVPAVFTDASQMSGHEPQKFDYTHMNQTTGATFYGRMVANLLAQTEPDVIPYLNAD
ncbi:SGNH/GDSL hydrolase family protein [Asticcacaulis sp. EMRT-3]|uniref:SGNH/GDSL hydrolase family protein n=1 Tax=Asticcacaulis sp. EMRT-3 TaxID=3040349 RepID=UPI0024AF1FF8|nr:SGNH/GDSL hydrolase family protein [Asticcacaulis sp. EMRT-3]MDI7776141.1 GDSL family lipase [Asticcacaulis sp. EMRT-3]